MAVNLTSGAITNISTGKCTANNIKPVVQVTYIHNRPAISDDEQWYWVMLSDGSFYQNGGIRVEAVRLNQLQKGSIVRLNDFVTYTIRKITVFLINDLNVIHGEYDLIGNPEPFPRNDTPLVERSTPPIPDEDHVDISHAQESVTSTQKCSETQSRKRKHQSSNETPVLERSKPTITDLDNSESVNNEDFDNGHHAQEPLATTQKGSSHSLTQSKIRKRRSSNDNISKVVEDVSKMTKLMMEKNKEDDVGACLKKLETLEKDVSIMTKMMIEKIKKDDAGACFKKLETLLETLGEDVSKLMRMVMEKNKEDVVGFNKLETLEEDVAKMTKMMMEKNKEDDVGACFEKLEILEEDFSKLMSMVMEKNKEDDVGACFKKLETLEKDASRMTQMMMEKNKDDVVGFKMLETLQKDVSRMMIEKNKEDVAGFNKLETLEEDVSKMTKMMMEKSKEDDVGACVRKLETLEEDISKLTRMVMEKNKEGVVGFNKLETLEEDVSKIKKMMMEKNKEDDVGACFKKFEILEKDVSKLTRMMMEKNKEDDMGACIEKLDKMGWGAEEPIYDTALLLFGQSADYRKLWLHLKPESCGKWVKNAGSMFGLLD